MSVLKSQLRVYGSASMSDTDGTTTGGAVSMAKKVVFVDITPTGLLDYVSGNASDTAVVLTVSGRDSTGVIVTEAKTLTGTTKVAGAQSFERLLKVLATGTTAVGDTAVLSHTAVVAAHTAVAGAAATSTLDATVTLQSGDGASVAAGDIFRPTNNSPAGVNFQLREIISISGDVVSVSKDWATVPSSATTYDVYQGMLLDLTPNLITEVRRPFYNAAADVSGGSTRSFHEKVFAVDNNSTTALTVAQIIKQADPSSGTLNFALTNALNDTSTIATRQTVPSVAITSFSSGAAPQTINVPSPQNLPSGAAPNAAGAQGIWLQLVLTAGLAPAKTSFTIRVSGQTT
jgi:hypothetical protein